MVKSKEKLQKAKGRSMIEMLGVLAIIAIIVLIGFRLYRMAHKQTKMNDLKNEVASISQNIKKNYVGTTYTDEGVVLGEDRTFKNLFVDTGIMDSNITPFGGEYDVTAMSEKLYRLDITNADSEEECQFIAQDDDFVTKLDDVYIACTTENEITEGNNFVTYAGMTPQKSSASGGSVNPDGSVNNNSSVSEGSNGDEYTPSEELVSSLSQIPTMDLMYVCTSSKNTAACDEFMTREDIPMPAYYGLVCSAGIQTACEKYATTGDTMFLRNACEGSNNDSVCQIYVDSGVSSAELKYACGNSGSDVVCGEYLKSNPASKDMAWACQGGSDVVCQAFMDTGSTSASELYTACKGGGEGACEKMAEVTSSSYYLGLACAGGNDLICEKLISLPSKSQGDLKSACRGGHEGACAAFLETNPDAQSLQETCSSGKDEATCAALLSSNPTDNNLGFACQGSGYDNVCQAWIDSGASVSNMSSGCGKQGSELLCQTACDRGDTRSCYNLEIINDGGWNN
ncbi:MAG: hypothetical protein N4A44_01185 [Alphaproteobacteria bacterium]|jgi:Tfp pilus assembly protein PilE|nr:hypothetical protein [Alphaproteobacteria bacterium]